MSKIVTIKTKELDIKNVVLKDAKVNPKYNNVSIPIAYKNPKNGEIIPFRIETPKLKAFVGISVYDQENSNPKYSLPLSIDKISEDIDHKKLVEFYENLDKLIVSKVHKNPNWIKQKKNVSKEVVKAFYVKALKYPIDKETGEISTKYPPNIRCKLLRKSNGTLECGFWKNKKERFEDPLKQVIAGARTKAIIEINSIWTVNGKFGITSKAIQCKVENPPKTDDYAFDSDSGEDDDEEDDNAFQSDDDDDDVNFSADED